MGLTEAASSEMPFELLRQRIEEVVGYYEPFSSPGCADALVRHRAELRDRLAGLGDDDLLAHGDTL